MDIELTEDEAQDIQALSMTIGVIGDVFKNGDGTTAALRMAIANLRTCADALEGFCVRWERSINDDKRTGG